MFTTYKHLIITTHFVEVASLLMALMIHKKALDKVKMFQGTLKAYFEHWRGRVATLTTRWAKKSRKSWDFGLVHPSHTTLATTYQHLITTHLFWALTWEILNNSNINSKVSHKVQQKLGLWIGITNLVPSQIPWHCLADNNIIQTFDKNSSILSTDVTS